MAGLGADKHKHLLTHLWLHWLLLRCLRAAADCNLLPLCLLRLCLLLLWGRRALGDNAAALDQVCFPALVVNLELQRTCSMQQEQLVSAF
jgi:hypothetical protein